MKKNKKVAKREMDWPHEDVHAKSVTPGLNKTGEMCGYTIYFNSDQTGDDTKLAVMDPDIARIIGGPIGRAINQGGVLQDDYIDGYDNEQGQNISTFRVRDAGVTMIHVDEPVKYIDWDNYPDDDPEEVDPWNVSEEEANRILYGDSPDGEFDPWAADKHKGWRTCDMA